MDENIILKNIDMIYCYSIGDKNAESIEKLFQITNKINSKIIIQDQTSFNFKNYQINIRVWFYQLIKKLLDQLMN